MNACPLWDEENEADHDCRDHQSGDGAAQGEPAMVQGLVEEIAERRPKWSRQNEGGPEQRDA